MKKITIIILTLFFLVACAKEEQPVVSSQMPVLGEENVEEMVVEEAKEISKVELELSQWKFTPDIITVKKGSHVILTLTSKDVDHGIGIAGYDVKQKLSAGATVDVEFDADKTGEFPFYCTVYCGSGHSAMKGKLIVLE